MSQSANMDGTNEIDERKFKYYESLSEAEKDIVTALNEFKLEGEWDRTFFRNKEVAARLLKPKIVDYLISLDCLNTMQIMKEFLEINLAIAKRKNSSQKVKIQATNAAADIAKSYSYLVDNIVKHKQRDEDDEKVKPPAPPSFYTVPPAAGVANSGEAVPFAQKG